MYTTEISDQLDGQLHPFHKIWHLFQRYVQQMIHWNLEPQGTQHL